MFIYIITIITIYIIIYIIIYIMYELHNPIKRYILAKTYFAKALALAKKKNKKLMVIGDPCTGNVAMSLQRAFPNSQHGDITIDLFGCDKCDKMDINDIAEWKKYETNSHVVVDIATLSFGKNLPVILDEIKRISGGDFFSSGGTTTLGWQYIGSKLYSRLYPNALQSMIYPFDCEKNKYYKYIHLASGETMMYMFS